MNLNPFEILGLPVTPVVEEGMVASRFTELSREHHPDAGGDRQRFEEINGAQRTLLLPSGCLRAFLEVTFPDEFNPKGTIGSELMDLFTCVGTVLQEATDVIKKKQAASSALALAALTGTQMEAQERLDETGMTIDFQWKAILRKLKEEGAAITLEEGEILYRSLSYLEKWRREIQEKRMQLFI